MMNYKTYLKMALVIVLTIYVVTHYIESLATAIGLPYVGN